MFYNVLPFFIILYYLALLVRRGMWGHWNYKMTKLGGAQANTPTKWQTCGVCEQPPLQNDKPAGCPNKHPYKMSPQNRVFKLHCQFSTFLYKMSPHYKMTEQGPLNAPKNHCPKNLYKISILQKSCSNDPKKISSTWRTCKAATNPPT